MPLSGIFSSFCPSILHSWWALKIFSILIWRTSRWSSMSFAYHGTFKTPSVIEFSWRVLNYHQSSVTSSIFKCRHDQNHLPIISQKLTELLFSKVLLQRGKPYECNIWTHKNISTHNTVKWQLNSPRVGMINQTGSDISCYGRGGRNTVSSFSKGHITGTWLEKEGVCMQCLQRKSVCGLLSSAQHSKPMSLWCAGGRGTYHVQVQGLLLLLLLLSQKQGP